MSKNPKSSGIRMCSRKWSPQQRLDHRSVPDPKTRCRLWTAGRNQSGYGVLTVGPKMWLAHRLSWTVARGPIPEGMLVCHRCDVRTCINPRHLFLGSYADNAADKKDKMRRRQEGGPRVERRPDKAPEILRIFLRGEEIVGRILSVKAHGACENRPLPTPDSRGAKQKRRRRHTDDTRPLYKGPRSAARLAGR